MLIISFYTNRKNVKDTTATMLPVLLICMAIFLEMANSYVIGDTKDFALRLNNSFGNNSKEGRLEVFYLGRWGTVCDDRFTNASARVACATLGFAYIGTVIGNRHGPGEDRIWLDDVNCTGIETGIEECPHLPWGQHDCSHSEDTSIICDCGERIFSGSTGRITSPNFPLPYAHKLDCNNLIRVAPRRTVIITFLAFNTEASYDWISITCESGNAFRSPRYSGVESPPVLTISSCTLVNVSFHTDTSTARTGFILTYNTTSDIVVGGFTTKPSSSFPRSDKNDPVIFNCTSVSKYLPWWTMNTKSGSIKREYQKFFYDLDEPADFRNYTITNSTCGVINSVSYSSRFRTESLGPGSCNLIVVAPETDQDFLVGSFVCTDSTFSSTRAILAPINLKLKITNGMTSLTAVTDIIREEELKISCNPSFLGWYSSSSLVFTYFLYRGGPVARIYISRTYWTSEGRVVSSNSPSSISSYVFIKAPAHGVIPRYTCNIVFDIFSSIANITANSPMSFSTEPVEVLYWPTEENMTIIGHKNGKIRAPALLYCNVASNPPATYTWTDESSDQVTKGPTITVNQGGKYTCTASNIIRGQYFQVSMSINLMDETPLQVLILGALLGASLLTIIIILAVVSSRKYRQQKRCTKVGRDQELRQRERANNRYEVESGNTTNAVDSENDDADHVYQQLKK